MSDVAEDAVDSSAVSDEEMEETSQENQSSPSKSGSKISAVGEILEGKRTKKTVERLDFQAPKQKEKLKIGDGTGDKLGDIPRTGHQITKMKPADLKPLHAIVFDRPGKMATIKKNLRLFNGFAFDADSEQFTKKRDKLLKNSNFTNSKLKVVCGVLDLEKKGTHSDLVDRILTFLVAPKNSGKRLPVKKKKKSKKKLSGDDSDGKTKKKSKPKPRSSSSSSSSPKKSKTGSKSKAIVMDSSSDEEEEEEEEKAGASAEAEGSDAEDKPSEKEDDRSDRSEDSADEEEEEDEDEEEEEEEESPKSKSSKGKSSSPKKPAAVKRPRTPAKKTAPPKKRARKEESDESAGDSEEEQKPRKKKPPPAKTAAKTKKADSSSNSKNNNTAEDSSDDDEPLIKMIKKAPTDEQLKETLRGLLKEANLEEMTMKQICQRVYDIYPDHDLTGRKDFIKQTVKALIT
ncbi:uncharacterized protein V6R79_015596 [Siganus canaliculatus]